MVFLFGVKVHGQIFAPFSSFTHEDNVDSKLTYLTVYADFYSNFKEEVPHTLQIVIPINEKEDVILDLSRTILHPGERPKITLSSQQTFVPQIAQHYSGKIIGEENSLATFSIYENEVRGTISNGKYMMNIQPIPFDQIGSNGTHVIFNERILKEYNF